MNRKPVTILKSHFLPSFCIVFFTLCGFLQNIAFAQRGNDVELSRYQRVKALQDIRPGEELLITIKDSILINGKWIRNRYALSNKHYKKKLCAEIVEEESSGHVLSGNASCLWSLTLTDGRYVISSVSLQHNLDADGTDLLLSDSPSNLWEIYPHPGGGFYVKHTLENRFLATNIDETQRCYFGCYINENSCGMQVDFYKKKHSFHDGGGVSIPASEGKVLFSCADSLLEFDDSGRMLQYASEQFENRDGSMANDGTLVYMNYKISEDSLLTFYNEKGQPLGIDFSEAVAPYQWVVYNGYITTLDKVRKYLVKGGAGVELLTVDEAECANVLPIELKYPGILADSLNVDGVMSLVGAWSAPRLSCLSWTNVNVLDLSKASLPIKLDSFRNRDTLHNTIIYVDSKSSGDIPQDWYFTVVCTSTGENQLIRKAQILDKKDLYLLYPFYAERGMLSYTRSMYNDGGWETLCLPFDHEIPQTLTSVVCTSINGGNLQCEKKEKVPANCVTLVKPSPQYEDEEVIISNLPGWVHIDGDVSAALQGTYKHLDFTGSSSNLYLLNNDGTAFVMARHGSTLSPFRAYLMKFGEAQQLNLPAVTRFSLVKAATTDNKVYTLDGRIVNMEILPLDRDILPQGVYLRNGKKYIIR